MLIRSGKYFVNSRAIRVLTKSALLSRSFITVTLLGTFPVHVISGILSGRSPPPQTVADGLVPVVNIRGFRLPLDRRPSEFCLRLVLMFLSEDLF